MASSGLWNLPHVIPRRNNRFCEIGQCSSAGTAQLLCLSDPARLGVSRTRARRRALRYIGRLTIDLGRSPPREASRMGGAPRGNRRIPGQLSDKFRSGAVKFCGVVIRGGSPLLSNPSRWQFTGVQCVANPSATPKERPSPGSIRTWRRLLEGVFLAISRNRRDLEAHLKDPT